MKKTFRQLLANIAMAIDDNTAEVHRGHTMILEERLDTEKRLVAQRDEARALARDLASELETVRAAGRSVAATVVKLRSVAAGFDEIADELDK